MVKTKLSQEDLLHQIGELSYGEFIMLVKRYTTKHVKDSHEHIKEIAICDLQARLEKLGINSTCPECGSSIIVKCGKRSNGIQRYLCTSCNTRFTRFSNTILEKTHWHWDVWIKVLNLMLNNTSIKRTAHILKRDFDCQGIDEKTIWLWRMKIMHALASYPLPKLSGVVQVDETFLRESQKGSRNLVSTVKGEERIPRYGRIPSKLGVMGPEFATITTAIDNTGHCVCRVSGLGKLTAQQFIEQFGEHLVDLQFLCSDANSTYLHYTELNNIPHYVKPSHYLSVLEKNHYQTGNKLSDEVKQKNQAIMQRLYKEGLIDRIYNRGSLTFSEFTKLKKQYGLSLGKVNALHKKLKNSIRSGMVNVSTKYLEDYIGFFNYIQNWEADHGVHPSSEKDAEEIFADVLKGRQRYTLSDVKKRTLSLQKPTGRYVSQLKKETKKARLATGNEHFKFDEEDGFKNFDKREYLSDIPKTKLYAICRECKLRGYTSMSRWTIVCNLMKHPDIETIIYRVLNKDRYYQIAEEDLKSIKDSEFKTKAKAPAD